MEIMFICLMEKVKSLLFGYVKLKFHSGLKGTSKELTGIEEHPGHRLVRGK